MENDQRQIGSEEGFVQQVLPEAPQSDEVGREPQEVYELK